MTEGAHPIFGLRKLPLVELLAADIGALKTQAKGMWELGFPVGAHPTVDDDVLLVDTDPYTEDDIQIVAHEGVDYDLVLDLDQFSQIRDFHNEVIKDDTADARLKSLLYYVAFDAFYDASGVADENWSALSATDRRE